MMINKECLGLVPDYMDANDAKERIKEIEQTLKDRPKSVIPAAYPVLEEELKELKRFLELTPQARYDKANTKMVSIKLNKKTDADILKKFESVDNIGQYIRRLIRDDIAKK